MKCDLSESLKKFKWSKCIWNNKCRASWCVAATITRVITFLWLMLSTFIALMNHQLFVFLGLLIFTNLWNFLQLSILSDEMDVKSSSCHSFQHLDKGTTIYLIYIKDCYNVLDWKWIILCILCFNSANVSIDHEITNA